ncbi:transcription termination/antitermination NusG family protein [Methylobacterium sp. ID0610]|uniref:transcription termination/antitermination NusG family protein n=1 Tax=Methylobacterium carpenticola TaxID=3344827 RepID=UPI0036899BDC
MTTGEFARPSERQPKSAVPMSRRSTALAHAAGDATDAPVLPADPALRLGERCRWSRDMRRSTAMAHAAGEPTPLRWHAAVTFPSCEIRVRDAMQRRGIDTVLPMIRFWRIRSRQRFIAERPLLARTVVFGLDHSCQDIANIEGLEHVVRGASAGWADLPEQDVYDLRLSILRGEFDATLRQSHPERPWPRLIAYLIRNGDLPPQAAWTHRQAKAAGLKFSVAA